MSLISKSIPSLVGGVSQQPHEMRFEGQAEEIFNAKLDVASGASKRPGTTHIAEMTDIDLFDDKGDFVGAAVHIWSRDDIEKYVIVISNASIKAYTLSGKPVKVNMGMFPPGSGVTQTQEQIDLREVSSKNYLRSTNPRAHFRFATMVDHTFILNRSKAVASKVCNTHPDQYNKCFFNFTYAATGVSYNINFGDDTISMTATSGSTIEIAQKFVDYINRTYTGIFHAGRLLDSAVVKLYSIDGRRLPLVTVADSYANQAVYVIQYEVEKFSDLPYLCNEGFVVQVKGSGANSSGYWVMYKGRSWVETNGLYTTDNGFNENTMPHVLSRGSDGEFYFHPAVWGEREVGDGHTNPFPSFTNRRISDIFFFRGRLGFLADENVVMSNALDYFNFWRTTATTTLDTDPIDVAANSSKATFLRHAIPFNKELLLFSDNAQFILNATGAMTASTVSITEGTSFACSQYVRPVNIGRNVTFSVERTNCSQIREYYALTNGQSVSADSSDSTAHVPSLIPRDVRELAVSQEDEILAVLTKNEDRLYMYKATWDGDKKVQSAWNTWTFDSADFAATKIISIEFLGSELYILLTRDEQLFLEKIVLNDTAKDGKLPFAVSLDRRHYSKRNTEAQGVYEPDRDRTVFTLPYSDSRTIGIVVGVYGTRVKSQQIGTPVPIEGMPIPSSAVTRNGNRFIVDGDWTNLDVVFGTPFVFEYLFSKQYLRDQQGVPKTYANVKMRRFCIKFSRSGEFTAMVWPHSRKSPEDLVNTTGDTTGGVLGIDYWQYPYRPAVANTSNSSVITESQYNMADRSTDFWFPVMTKADAVGILISSESYVPVCFYAAEWEGFMTARSQRIG